MGPGFCPEFGCRALPAQSVWQGSGFAADQTNAMLAVVRADDESPVPPQAAELALSVARPLPTETALLGFGGSPVGEVIKLPFCIFSAFLCGGGITTLRLLWLCRNNPRGVYFGRKTAFSEWVLCADGCVLFPPAHSAFLAPLCVGRYHYPRRALHAVETLDAQELRRRIRRFMPPRCSPCAG